MCRVFIVLVGIGSLARCVRVGLSRVIFPLEVLDRLVLSRFCTLSIESAVVGDRDWDWWSDGSDGLHTGLSTSAVSQASSSSCRPLYSLTRLKATGVGVKWGWGE